MPAGRPPTVVETSDRRADGAPGDNRRHRPEHVVYGYDRFGRAEAMGTANMSDPVGGTSLGVILEQYEYDDAGNLEWMYRHDDGDAFTYQPVTRFGESQERSSTTVTEQHGWDPTTSRMTSWQRAESGIPTADRSFSYDAGGRLVEIDDALALDTTVLYYDVDDNIVVELRQGETIERFDGLWVRNGVDVIDQVLGHVRVERDLANAPNGGTFKTVLPDLDGHAVVVFDKDGLEERREVTGIYGVPVWLDRGGAEPWHGGIEWAVDGLHGKEEDLVNEVVHYGARHTLHRDGMWMQPEPLLHQDPTGLGNPRMVGSVYAGANSLVFDDITGNTPNVFVSAALSPLVERHDGDVTQAIKKQPDKVANRVGKGMTQAAIVGTALATPGPEDVALGVVAATATAKAVVRGAVKLLGDVAGSLGRGLKASPCNCFVADTQVAIVGGTLPIEQVHEGDRVLAMESPEPGEWAEVETKPQPRRSEVPSQAWCTKLARAGRKAALPLLLAGCEATAAVEDLGPVVTAYKARSGAWSDTLTEEIGVGDEVLHDGHLLRVTEAGVELIGPAAIDDLEASDATWEDESARLLPHADDWVLGLEDDGGFGHVRLRDLALEGRGVERFAFGGRVFDALAEHGDLAIRPTGEVLGFVYRTHVRPASQLIDVFVTGDQTLGTLTGTPDHPFWVNITESYVPLGELGVGTVLRTVGGGDAAIGSMDWRRADVEVFNFEVRDVHNYFVQSDRQNRAVLVHNGCGTNSVGGVGKVGSIDKPPRGPGSVPKADRDTPRTFPAKDRDAKIAEQGGKCGTGCGTDISRPGNARGHHKQRHADGGKTDSENHVEVCVDCHKKLHAP